MARGAAGQGSLQVRRSGGLLSPRTEQLVVAGRDRTGLLQGLARQVEAVTRELADTPMPMPTDVPVRGVLCSVGTELPWSGESVAGVPLVARRGLVQLLTRPGDLDVAQREAVAAHLAGRLPAAR